MGVSVIDVDGATADLAVVVKIRHLSTLRCLQPECHRRKGKGRTFRLPSKPHAVLCLRYPGVVKFVRLPLKYVSKFLQAC